MIRQVPRVAWLLAAAALAERLLWLGLRGVQWSYDTGYYLEAADLALREGLLAALATRTGAWKYSSSIALVTVLRALFGEHAATAWVLLGVLASALAFVPLYLLARRLYGARVALVASLLLLACFDLLQWASFALTDTLFVSATIAFVWALVRAREEPRPAAVGLAVGLALVLATMRIAGAAIVAIGILWLALEALWPILARATPRARRIAAFALGLLALLAVPATIHALGVVNPALVGYWATGEVVDDDPATAIDVAFAPRPGDGLLDLVLAEPLDAARLSLAKAAGFWTVFAARWSWEHHLVNALTLLPIVALGAPMLVRVGVERDGHPGRRLLALLVVGLTAFHALTVVDFDLRYRAPALPFAAVLAAVPLARLVERARGRLRGAEAPAGPSG